MTGVNVIKRSAAAAGANTDTVIITPAAGQKMKILAFWVVKRSGGTGGRNGL